MSVVTDAQTHLQCVLITDKQCVQLSEPPSSSLLMSRISLSLLCATPFIIEQTLRDTLEISTPENGPLHLILRHVHSTFILYVRFPPFICSLPHLYAPLHVPPSPLFSLFFLPASPSSLSSTTLPPPFSSLIILHSQRCDVGARLRLNIETERKGEGNTQQNQRQHDRDGKGGGEWKSVTTNTGNDERRGETAGERHPMRPG